VTRDIVALVVIGIIILVMWLGLLNLQRLMKGGGDDDKPPDPKG